MGICCHSSTIYIVLGHVHSERQDSIQASHVENIIPLSPRVRLCVFTGISHHYFEGLLVTTPTQRVTSVSHDTTSLLHSLSQLIHLHELHVNQHSFY